VMQRIRARTGALMIAAVVMIHSSRTGVALQPDASLSDDGFDVTELLQVQELESGSFAGEPLYLHTPTEGMAIDVQAALKKDIPDLLAEVKPIKFEMPHFHPPFDEKASPIHKTEVKPPPAAKKFLNTPTLPSLDANIAGSYKMLTASDRDSTSLSWHSLAESEDDGSSNSFQSGGVQATSAATAAVAVLKLANLKEQCTSVDKLCETPEDGTLVEKCKHAVDTCESHYTIEQVNTCQEYGNRAKTPVPMPTKTATHIDFNHTRLGLAIESALDRKVRERLNSVRATLTDHPSFNDAHKDAINAAFDAQPSLIDDVVTDAEQSVFLQLANGWDHPTADAENKNATRQENPLSSEALSLALPQIASSIGQASYTKVLCSATKASCLANVPSCKVSLHQCEHELKKIIHVLCETGAQAPVPVPASVPAPAPATGDPTPEYRTRDN